MSGARKKRRDAYLKDVSEHTQASIEKKWPNGVPGGKTVDHTISKAWGFDHEVEASVIGHMDNLQPMDWNKNIEKGRTLTPEGIQILRDHGYTDMADAMEMKADQLEEMRRAA